MTQTATRAGTRATAGLMQAAVLEGPRQFELRELPVPEPASGQVRVRLESCGVCASSLPLWEGREWFEYPREPGAPGHEGCGVIEAVGEDADEALLGERVALLSYHAFASHDLVSAFDVVTLPTELEGRHFPGEAIGCAMNIFRRSEIKPGCTVAVVGCGFIGALLTQLAARSGARVVAFSRRAHSLEVAKDMGAVEAVATDDCEEAMRVGCGSGRGLFDVVIECTGLQEPLDLASRCVRERGRLVIAGFHQDGPRQINLQDWNWRGIDVINAHEREVSMYLRGMREGVEAVASGQLDPDPLYTHRLPLERINEAFEAASERPEGFVKAIVTME